MIQWKHRLVSLLVCAAMLFSLCPTAAWGEEETAVTVVKEGALSEGLSWSLYSDGTLTITGTGEMPNFSRSSQPWYSTRANITRVVIGEGVTSVGESAFYDEYTALTSVELPSTLNAIGKWAFRECGNLTSVQFPEGLETIGQEAFESCTRLAQIRVPASVTKIEDRAFEECSAIRSMTFAGTEPPEVGSGAFDFYGSPWEQIVYVPYGAEGIYENKKGEMGLPLAYIMEMLAVPETLAWDTATPGTATWSAVSEADSYKVRLYREGSSEPAQTVTVEKDENGTLPLSVAFAATEAGNYTFTVTAIAPPYEWGKKPYADSEESAACENTADFNTQVAFNTNGGAVSDGSTEIDPQYVAADGLAIEPEQPTKERHVFAGWYADADFAETAKWDFASSKVPKDGVTLHAKWLGIHGVTVDNSAGGGTASASIDLDDGSSSVAAEATEGETIKLTATADAGYRLAKWEVISNGSAVPVTPEDETTATFIMPAGNVTVKAIFAKEYAVSVSAEPAAGGSASASVGPDGGSSSAAVKATKDETVTLTAKPNDGYRLAGWKVVSNGNCIAVTPKDETTATFTMPAEDVIVTAAFEAETYKVTLVLDKAEAEEDGKQEISYTYGVGVTLPTADITREGYAFGGWYTNEECTEGPVEAIGKEEYGNKTFYAKWEAKAYDVKVNVENDGYGSAYASTKSADEHITTAATDETVTLTATAKAGYRFVRWEEEVPEGETGVTIENAEKLTATFTMPARAVAVKAVFTAGEYNVTLECNGGTLTDGDPVRSYTHGEGMTLPTKDDITLDDYTFRGWYRDIECTDGPVEVISTGEYGDKTFYAKWELKATHIDPIAVRYIIEHYKEDADSAAGYTLAATEYSVGEIGKEVTAKPKAYDGFTYNEAESKAKGTLTAISSADDIVTLTLYYDVTRYAVTVDGSYAEESGAGSYAADDTVTIHAGTREGYVFSGWTSDDGVTFVEADDETTTFVMPAGAVTVTAVFRALHGVSTEKDGQGKVTVSPDDAAKGTTVTVTAEPEDGYRFVEWKGTTVSDGETGETVEIIFDDPTSPETTFTMPDGAVTITAVFQAIYGINTENDEKEGKVTVSPDDAAEGTTVKVTAEPEEGYRFVEWKGTTVSGGETVDIIFDDPTSPETTFTMPAGAVTITAVFEKVTPAAPEQAETSLSDEAAVLLGVGIVATGAAAAAAYYYRDFLPVWKLGGVVKLPDGTPAANAAIELWRDGALVKTLTTDETGAFAARVPKGTYEAVVTWEQDGTAYTARASLTAETALVPAGPEDLIVTPEETEAPAAPS